MPGATRLPVEAETHTAAASRPIEPSPLRWVGKAAGSPSGPPEHRECHQRLTTKVLSIARGRLQVGEKRSYTTIGITGCACDVATDSDATLGRRTIEIVRPEHKTARGAAD